MSIPHRVDRFISLATLWDMLTAATLLGSVMPIIPLPLQEKYNAEHDSHHIVPTNESPIPGFSGSPCGESNLPGITSFVQKLRHLSGLSTSCLTTDDDTGVFSDCLHDDLLLCQHGQLQSGLLQ